MNDLYLHDFYIHASFMLSHILGCLYIIFVGNSVTTPPNVPLKSLNMLHMSSSLSIEGYSVHIINYIKEKEKKAI